MLFRESETIELKEIVTDEIKKEIIAFANCNGGKLYIGVKDDGTVIGVDDAVNVSLQISNMERYLTRSNSYQLNSVNLFAHPHTSSFTSVY